MKSSTVWHGHSTQPSLPAGTARKASGHLSERGSSILLTQDRSVAQKPHWGFCCCANASLPWQAEQAHHTPSKEKQSVPDGERPVVHIVVVGGFFRVRPIQGRTLFLFCLISPCFAVLFSLPTGCKRRRAARTPRTKTMPCRCPWCG